MDRFIAIVLVWLFDYQAYLKSNMDRFIGVKSKFVLCEPSYLKSNMDRFIVQSALAIFPSFVI